MTESERNVLLSLVVVAWADGQLAEGETGVIEGLLSGFDATEEEEAEVLEFARTPRTLERDIPVETLGLEDRELLLSNAALLTLADGQATDDERNLLGRLSTLLGFAPEEAEAILSVVQASAGNLHGTPETD